MDGEAWTLSTSADGLPSDQVTGVLLAKDALWVSADQAVARFDPETGEQETIPQAGIYALHQVADGRIWLGGEWRALRFDPEGGDWLEFEGTKTPL